MTRARLKLLLQWIAAVVILWLLFRRIPFRDAVAAAANADLWIFVPAAFAVALFRFWTDAATVAWAVTRFHTPFPGREARSVYALVNVVNIVNWGLGVAVMLRHLRRAKGVRLLDSTSTAFLCGHVDGTIKIGIGLGGMAILLADPALRSLAGLVVLLFVGHLLALGFLMSERPAWRWARRVREWRLLRTPVRATLRDLAVLVPLRTLNVGLFVVFVWIGLHAFDVPVSPTYLLASMPVVLIVAEIPLTPSGLGTQQAAMLYFYRSVGAEADILAFGILFPVAFMAARLLLGAFYLPDLARLRAAERDESSSSQSDAIASES